jgi:Tfp pilus assembly protein PilN
MVQGNTTGSAQHKVKTINVEVNLLDAWIIQRADLERTFYRKFAFLSVILLAGIFVIPYLFGQQGIAAQKLNSSEAILSTNLKKRETLLRKAKVVTPSIQMDEMVVRCHRFSSSYLNELTKVINAAPALVYFEQFQTEVNNGECSIKVLANAASPDAGRDFVDIASAGPNVLAATQTSVRQSQLTPTSIKFDFIKRVSL